MTTEQKTTLLDVRLNLTDAISSLYLSFSAVDTQTFPSSPYQPRLLDSLEPFDEFVPKRCLDFDVVQNRRDKCV